MPDVAFDSERHAQVSGDMSAGGGELTTSATSALMIDYHSTDLRPLDN